MAVTIVPKTGLVKEAARWFWSGLDFLGSQIQNTRREFVTEGSPVSQVQNPKLRELDRTCRSTLWLRRCWSCSLGPCHLRSDAQRIRSDYQSSLRVENWLAGVACCVPLVVLSGLGIGCAVLMQIGQAGSGGVFGSLGLRRTLFESGAILSWSSPMAVLLIGLDDFRRFSDKGYREEAIAH